MYIRRRDYANGKAQVEFELGGSRHRPVVAATTDKEARRAGELAKTAIRADLAEQRKVTSNTRGDAPLDLGLLFAKYFLSATGLDLVTCPATAPNDKLQMRSALLNMLVYFRNLRPALTSVIDITDDVVEGLVRWRATQYRYEPQIRERCTAQGRQPTAAELQRYGLVSPSHVHATTTKPLQAVFTYARTRLKLALSNEPTWVDLRPKILPRAKHPLRDNEQVALERVLPDGYGKFLAFSITSCMRKSASMILWDDVHDLCGERPYVSRRSKGGKITNHPLTAKAVEIIKSCQGDHPTHVFTYLCRRGNSSRGLVLGRRYPISERSLASVWDVAREQTGLKGKAGDAERNYKWHHNRVTGATEIYHAKGVKEAQIVLGHTNSRTTDIYLAIASDVARGAMEEADAKRDSRLAGMRQVMQEQALLEAPKPRRRHRSTHG